MSALENLVKSRRSAVIFEEGIEIPEADLQQMFALNKFAPSAFNLQHTHYLVLTDPAQKKKLTKPHSNTKSKPPRLSSLFWVILRLTTTSARLTKVYCIWVCSIRLNMNRSPKVF